jgi:tetratricopeptide (TPR) repeat protein
VYYNKSDYDLAIRDYNEAIRLKPDYAFAYVGRGMTYAAKRDFDRAIQDYNEAIRLDPNAESAYENRGVAHAFEGDHESLGASFCYWLSGNTAGGDFGFSLERPWRFGFRMRFI